VTREEFIAKNPIMTVLEHRGVRVIGGGAQRSVKCPFHEDRTASMSVNVTTGLWHCHAGCGGGSVIDLIARFDNITPIQVLKSAGVNGNGHVHRIATREEPLKWETVATYNYEDTLGNIVYQVVRQHAPVKDKECGYVKTFRQRRPVANGWVWDMEGVERVLYRLPEWANEKSVWIVEGEKDAETLIAMGFNATCNVGGAGKWLDAYTESLHKKHVTICGDNDEVGKNHVKTVFDSIAGKVKTLRLVKVPESFKDVSDYAASFDNKEDCKHALEALWDAAMPHVKGVGMPIYKMSELEPGYERFVQNLKHTAYNLGKWIPGMYKLRGLVPGDLALILAGTGIGKTASLTNIAKSARPLPTLFFELELPAETMYERSMALSRNLACKEVETTYKNGESLGENAVDSDWPHLYICTQPALTVKDLEMLISRSELKIGQRPKLVLLDYIQLMKGQGKSRYERISQVAEDLKNMAKALQTIVIVSSQVSRKGDDSHPDVTLQDGKDSGSLENSSGLVLGLWRPSSDTAKIRVLKSTKGGAGMEFECDYNVKTLAITERSKVRTENDN